jgi:hypothetical protein
MRRIVAKPCEQQVHLFSGAAVLAKSKAQIVRP